MRPTDRALVLARGLGRRMRKDDPGVQLTADQQRAAEAGLKTLMPAAELRLIKCPERCFSKTGRAAAMP